MDNKKIKEITELDINKLINVFKYSDKSYLIEFIKSCNDDETDYIIQQFIKDIKGKEWEEWTKEK